MKTVVKQVAGIDVAKNELVVSFGKMHDDWTPELCAFKTFANTVKGYELMLKWVIKVAEPQLPIRFVMEATGVYHEAFAYYLDNKSLEVSIVLPNKISNYARSLAKNTVTDKTASEAIMLFGLERKLDRWHKPKKVYRDLRVLTRERSQLIEERTMLKNQLHAEQIRADSSDQSIGRMNKRITLLNKQLLEIKKELSEAAISDQQVKQDLKLLCSLPGVGELTAATIMGETNGFDLIRNKRQLTSYAGLDVREKQSGTSVKGKPRISKKGNRHLRKAMHMPALSAIKKDDRFKAVFARLVSKHGIKMKAAVAVQRKLLEMAYTIFKTQKPYDENYFINQGVTLQKN
ncbi:IS110 family RNA-guided transposase [Pinibacter aurantiacus]|uniref:IS110 family transposase n=1 Tax=Pinibacter aurantiacus TaxID=2851599 RepID=A0A9E2W767_9BACT|nr:IS110 family transposase [Pinibacter aurantiacus]MBV4360678.1 IS110 family transposase [Pinibacter aurantiacus]